MRPARIIALTAALVAAFVVSGPATAGSDSPTPYAVTSAGIDLPRPLAAHDHVNVRLADGRTASLHLEPGAPQIGATHLPWSALGITDGCPSWVQVAGYDEHFGEGGQPPVCLSTTPTPTPTPEPSWTAAPEPTVEPTPSATPTSPEPSSSPSPTQPAPSPEPSVTVEPTSEPEPPVSSPSPSPTSTPTPSSTPSTEPSPDLDVDHPEPEPDLPPTLGPPPVDTTTIAEPLPDTLPVTGAGTTLAWIAGGLLALGAVLVMVARRRNA